MISLQIACCTWDKTLIHHYIILTFWQAKVGIINNFLQSVHELYMAALVIEKGDTDIMKGTKVLTLGAGREVLPHNMAVTKMQMRMTYIHALYLYACDTCVSTHARYC